MMIDQEDSHKKVVHQEGIQVEHDAANITNDLSEDTSAHCTHESPCSTPDAKPQLPTEESEEAEHVDDISGNSWSIVNGLP